MRVQKKGLGSAVVVSSATPVKHLPAKRRLIAVIGAVVLIGIILVVVILIGNRNANNQSPKEQDQAHTQALTSVANDDKTGKYSDESQKLQSYINSNPPDQYAATESVRLATSYQNSHDYENAIKWYKIALDKYPGDKLAATRGLAFTYRDKGDKAQALTYFRQAVEIENSDPTTKYLVGKDQNNIRFLEGEIKP
jgi:predicted negative regulator of RcsB-dependent stress response